MRILQVCPDSYVDIGGISVHVRNIAERLAKDHDVTVFATNDNGMEPWSETKNGVKIKRFRCYAPQNSYFFTIDLPLKLRKERFDVVHAHGYHQIPLHVSTGAKCDRFVVTPHFHGVGHTPFRSALVQLFKPFGGHAFSRADKIVAVSEYEKSLLCHQFRSNGGKVVVIPNGVNYGEFTGVKKNKRNFRSILYVGYLAGFKGAQYLVEILSKIPEDVVLEVVGRGPMKSYMEKRAQKLGVRNRLRFYHGLSRQELIQKFVDSDVFSMLSLHEAYSIVVAEALSAKIPCIVARSSALNEWVDNETCFGVGVPIDLRRLANDINSVLDNPPEKSLFKKWIGNKILDWNQVTNNLEKLYVE